MTAYLASHETVGARALEFNNKIGLKITKHKNGEIFSVVSVLNSAVIVRKGISRNENQVPPNEEVDTLGFVGFLSF